MVELKEGVDVQYLGVYVLKWQPEWGPPTVGFVERNAPYFPLVTYICAHCSGYVVEEGVEVEVLDSGTTLSCIRCGEDTIVDLDTPEVRAKRYKAEECLKELEVELGHCNLNLEGHRKANTQLKEDLRLEAEACRRLGERIKELEVELRDVEGKEKNCG